MKNFVLDTNVILHDADSIYNFEENNIYLPIVVLEELDRFKKGNEQINFNAREFIRELDKITDNSLFTDGAQLGPGLGRLYIVIGDQYNPEIVRAFPEKIPDHRILSTTKSIINAHPNEETILVTKDINLRMKARSLGIKTEDYYSDKVKNTDQFDKEQRIIEVADPMKLESLYKSNHQIEPGDLGMKPEDFTANECFTLSSGTTTMLARYNPHSRRITRIEKASNSGIRARNAEQAFSLEVLDDPEIRLVALTGRAGTGKTLLALAAALQQASRYNQILLMRPIVSLSNKDIGFLPGSEEEKIAPYMQPLFDNLNVIKYQQGVSEREINDLQSSGRLSIEALAFIRGRSLSDTYCIIDEAQNLTPHEIKTIITRAGEGTKMVFTGDIHQIDSPYLDSQSNGLAYMIDKMKNHPLFAHVNLVKGERSELAEVASNLL